MDWKAGSLVMPPSVLALSRDIGVCLQLPAATQYPLRISH